MTTQGSANANVEGFVQSVLTESFEAFKNDLVLYILSGLILVFVSGFSLFVLLGPLMVGFVQLVRRRRRAQPAEMAQIFEGLQRFGTSFLLMLVIGIAMVIGSMLFFLPALAVGLVVMFAFQAVIYKDAGVIEALKTSFELVKTNFIAALVLFVVLLVLNSVAGAVLIGMVITLPFSLVATTIAYEKLTGQI